MINYQEKFIDDVKREKNISATKIAEGVWLTFLPVMDTDEFGDDVVRELKLHLLNGTVNGYNFIYKQMIFGNAGFELKNTIHAAEDFYLHDVPFEDMNDNPSFDFEFTLLNPDKTKADYYEHSLKLRAKQIFSKIEEIQKKKSSDNR